VLRFCRVKKFDEEKTKDAFVNAMKWRRDFGVDTLRESDIDPALFEANILYFNKETDVAGRPVAIAHVLNHDRRNFEAKEMRRFAVFHMERGIKLLSPGMEAFSLIFDLTNFGAKNMDLSFVQFLVSTLTRFYPERIAALVLYNAPWVFNGFWTLVKPLLDEHVTSVIHFANGEEIFKYVAKEKLPERLGGHLDDTLKPTAHFGRPLGHQRNTSVSSATTSLTEESTFYDSSPSSAVLEVCLFELLCPFVYLLTFEICSCSLTLPPFSYSLPLLTMNPRQC